MVATFPLALANLADLLNIRSVTWLPYRQQELSGIGSGEFLTADLAPMLWEAKCETATMSRAAAEQLAARFELLDGSAKAWYLTNPRALYPQADPDGSTLGASTITITAIGANRNTVTLSGFPEGYVLTIGDMVSVTDADDRVHLLRIAETKTATALGNISLIEVRPVLRSGITTTLAVTVKKPFAKVKVVPGSFDVQQVGVLEAVITFTARQTLQAN